MALPELKLKNQPIPKQPMAISRGVPEYLDSYQLGSNNKYDIVIEPNVSEIFYQNRSNIRDNCYYSNDNDTTYVSDSVYVDAPTRNDTNDFRDSVYVDEPSKTKPIFPLKNTKLTFGQLKLQKFAE